MTAESTRTVLRHRTLIVWVLPAFIMLMLLLTDPDPGDYATTKLWAIKLMATTIGVALAHWTLKAIFDYEEADRRELFKQALAGNAAAGLGLVAQAIVFGFLVAAFTSARGQDVRGFVPPKCRANMAILEAEMRRFWPDHPMPGTVEAQAEKESCVSLRSARCCDTTARFKTDREEGASILQITRTWRKDGSQRFDALAELRQLHPVLADWSWENVYKRPDLANRALVLKDQDNTRFFARFARTRQAAVHMGLAGYNGGNGDVQLARRACAMARNCDPGLWVGNVELHCVKGSAPLYGRRSACDINRDYPADIGTRTPKYRRLIA